MTATYLVTGATGNIGRSVVSTLLSKGQHVHALVRNDLSSESQKLAAQGVTLFKGDFSSASVIRQASGGCSGVFILLIPGPEVNIHVENILKSFRAASSHDAAVVIITSIMQSDASTKLIHQPNAGLPFPPSQPQALTYWNMNNAAETAVMNSGFLHWTILRPAFLMSNYIDNSVRPLQWPTLSTDRTLVAGVKLDTLFDLSDPDQVGSHAAYALMERGQPQWEHRRLEIVSERLTLSEKAMALSRVSDIKVKAVHSDETAATERAAEDFLFYLNFWQMALSSMQQGQNISPRYKHDRVFGVGMFEAYLVRNRQILLKFLLDGPSHHNGEGEAIMPKYSETRF